MPKVYTRRGRLLRPASTVYRKVPFDSVLGEDGALLAPSISKNIADDIEAIRDVDIPEKLNFERTSDFTQLSRKQRDRVLQKLKNSSNVSDTNRYRELVKLHDDKIDAVKRLVKQLQTPSVDADPEEANVQLKLGLIVQNDESGRDNIGVISDVESRVQSWGFEQTQDMIGFIRGLDNKNMFPSLSLLAVQLGTLGDDEADEPLVGAPTGDDEAETEQLNPDDYDDPTAKTYVGLMNDMLPIVTGPKPTRNKKALSQYYTKSKQFVRYAFYLDSIQDLPVSISQAIDTIEANNPNVKGIQNLITQMFGAEQSFVDEA